MQFNSSSDRAIAMPKYAMRCSFGIYVFFLGYVHVYGQPCPINSVGHTVYGPDCKYLCHCKIDSEQCDYSTGSCVSGCANEWMGPGCQYRDILWGKEASQLEGSDAYKAVDGWLDTCSISRSRDGSLWWRAWFGQPEMIRGLVIVTKYAQKGYFSEFKVYVENTSEKDAAFQQQETCYEHDGKTPQNTTIAITCMRPMRGNQVRIQLASNKTRLVLCDVRMFGGRNLAYSKSTQQSSTWYNYVSSKAVDGDVERTCAVTNQTNPTHTWTVDLGDIFHVQALQLISDYNFKSTDTIQVGVDSYSYKVQPTPSEVKTYFLTSDSDARYLQFKRMGSYISLCEVLIYGECLEYKCGLDCSIPCHCAVFTFENKVSGECLEGCAVGWTGQGRRCDTECSIRHNGFECQERCSGHCLDNDVCDKVDARCPRGCAAGWMGDKCDAACPAGTFGVNCNKQCSSNCVKNGDCDKNNGHCSRGCAAGWMGNTCNTGCVEGLYGPNCSYVCSKHCSTTRVCYASDGRCKNGCEPGWKGEKCDEQCDPGRYGPACLQICSGHCLNSVKCDNVRGQCPQGCAAGWMGEKCDIECSDGTYGPDCYYPCSNNCLGSGPCDKQNGLCQTGCKPGWTDNTCRTECIDRTYGHECKEQCSDHCVGNDVCRKVDGHCPRGCSAGWKGEKCQTACAPGTFGLNCSQSCGRCWNNVACYMASGRCPSGCEAGWIGADCKTACRDGWYGRGCITRCSGHCANNDYCEKKDGLCPFGCAAGWLGERCTEECKAGYYGTNCTNRCSIHCWPSSYCNKADGKCSCKNGWTGIKCDEECPDGTYGNQCRVRCSGHCLKQRRCNKTNGHCDYGCSTGYKGPTCHWECRDGTYGLNCSKQCSGHCMDNGVCDKSDGHCPRGCADGWMGDKCDAECNEGAYGLNCSQQCSGHCVDNSTCDKVHGDCPWGCAAGWRGAKCDAVCSHGWYGVNCRDRCSSHCHKESLCDKANGRCEGGCKAGWQGLTCITECNNDTYGAECSGQCSGHCMNNDVCDKVNGRCARGCAAGWMGDQCDAECPGGTYGINCRHNCSGHCLNEAFCNRFTGMCDERCKPGWTGSTCNDECLNGTFGMDCFHNCSGHCVDKEPCNKTDGHCDGGCETGWQGSLCEIVVLSVHDEQNNESVVLATIVAVLALLGVVIVTVVAYKRFYIPSRRNKRHQEPVPVQSSDETAYVNRMIASGLDSVDRLPLRNRASDNADQSQQHAAALAQDGCEYYNLVERTAPIVKMPEHGILLANLIRFLENEKHHPGKLAAEFAEIPTIAEHSCLEAQKSRNKHKNRYQQMYPYDHNRVILHTVGSDPSSDYINASHIDGYKLRDAFIAAQGTTKANIGDFWRLIWEKKINVIVMLTELYEQGKMKCERYWDSTGPITFGDITVTVLSEEQFAEFTIRTFLAKYVGNKSPLLVHQYHYTAWPDKSCPDGTASLLCFWGRVNKNKPKSDTPWLVHCSAGVGRTGTFIALDILISQGRDTGYVDVYGCVEALRQQRVFMVQTKGQYIYLHELVADALVLHSLPASTDEFLRLTSSGASAVDSAWNDVTEHMMIRDNRSGNDSRSKSGVMKENRHKNRFESIVPDDQYRPYLSMTSDGGSNYINAVYMPSYRRKHGLILTQTPLPTTTADWWRLVLQNRIQTVLAFEDTPTSENIGSCFPMDRKLEKGQFQTRQMSFEQDRGFTISKHNLFYEGESRELTFLQYQEWRNDQLVPSDSVTMLHFCLEVLALQNQHLDSPLLIQCFDGATRSGLMAVLLNALDRLCVEEEVAVLQILHHLRLRRPQIVPNKEQLQFCFDVIRHQIQKGSTYANL